MKEYYFYVLISLILALIGQNYIFNYLQKYLIDIPNIRSSHTKPIPKGGGIIFVIIGSLGALLLKNELILYCLPLTILGFIDDWKNISSLIRFLVQILTSILILFKVSPDWLFSLQINQILFLLILGSCIFLMTAIINFINFMDGLDGLLSSCMLLIFLFISLNFSNSYLPLCGALLVFIFWNWQPAKVFMGNVGSSFLGVLFAATIFNTNSPEKSIALLICSLPLIFDSTFCVIRRFFDGQKIFHAHKLHLYQRLNQAGWSHAKVTLFYSISILFLCLAYQFFGIIYQLQLSIVIFIIGFLLDKYVAYPFDKITK